jgi:hypothetical protein
MCKRRLPSAEDFSFRLLNCLSLIIRRLQTNRLHVLAAISPFVAS